MVSPLDLDTESASPRTDWSPLNVLFTLLLVAGSFLPFFAAYHHHTYLNDDTYITLTYAQNLARGNGFVYNHTPPTFGTTTPLLTIIVAVLGALLPTIEVHVVAVIFTALCWLGTAWLPFLFRRAWRLSAWQAALVGLAILGTGWVAFLGMEVYLFAFLLMLTISLFYAERPFLAGFGAGLLYLTRGEGIIVWVLLAMLSLAHQWRQRGTLDFRLLREPLILSLGFAIPVGFWTGYALLTFGTVLPNTLRAKQAQGALDSGRPMLERLAQEWMPTWGRRFPAGRMPYFNLWWLLAIVGIANAAVSESKRRWLALAAWIAMYLAGYIILGVSAYWWYQLPVVFVAQVFVGLGMVAILEFCLTHISQAALRALVLALVVGIAFLGFVKPIVEGIRVYQGDPRAPAYLELAQWLRENSRSSESVAFIEIGYLGYYTDNRIVDLAGLVIPEIVPHVRDGDYSWGFWQYRPDYFIYQPAFDLALGDIIRDPRFPENYEPVVRIKGHLDADYTIYKRMPGKEISLRRSIPIPGSREFALDYGR